MLTARIHIMKYSEERAAQRANSERLNLVLAYLTDEDMHVRKRYKAEGKKKTSVRIREPDKLPISTNQTRKTSCFLGH